MIVVINKYLLGTYYVPGTVYGTWNIWKSHHLKVLPSTETPGADYILAKVSFQWLTWITTSSSQQWQQAKLLKRELLILQLYFACHSERCLLWRSRLCGIEEQRVSYKFRNREVLELQVNHLVGNSEITDDRNIVGKSTKRILWT